MRRLSRALQRGEALAGAGGKWMISWRPCLRSARGAPTVAPTGAMAGLGLEGVDFPSALAKDTIRGFLGAPVGLVRIPEVRKLSRLGMRRLPGGGSPGRWNTMQRPCLRNASALRMVRLWGLWRGWIGKDDIPSAQAAGAIDRQLQMYRNVVCAATRPLEVEHGVCELYRSAACGQEVLKCTLRKTCIPTFVKAGMSVILAGKVTSWRRD